MTTHYELVAMIVVLALAMKGPLWLFDHPRIKWIATRFNHLASRRCLAVWVVGIVSLSMHLPSVLLNHYVKPSVHDEFSYLLAADTFAQGRLTNPTPPMWEHFESFHIIMQPSYMSKYPPGQSLFLAMGQYLFGHPLFGVWISLALACAAICWMLQAWVPVRWALLGGLLAALRLTPGAWGQTYWGGAVAALGGALLFGALRRAVQRQRWRDGFLLGLGASLLILSRPYESAVIMIFIGILAVFFIARLPHERRPGLIRPAVAAVIILAFTFAWLGYYNWRVTGDSLTMPYQVYTETYGQSPIFFWQPKLTNPPTYRHKEFVDLYEGWELTRFLRRSSLLGFNDSLVTKLWVFFRFFIGPAFVVPFLLLARYSSHGWYRFATTCVVLTIIALSQVLFLFPHYAAPITCLTFALAMAGMRYMRLWKWRGRPTGRFLITGTVAVFIVAPAILPIWKGGPLVTPRSQVAKQLTAKSGKHLVLVSYGDDHSCHQEWVYNRAQLQTSKIVWARTINPQQDQKLVEIFNDRTVWAVKVNHKSHKLKPWAADYQRSPAAQ